MSACRLSLCVVRAFTATLVVVWRTCQNAWRYAPSHFEIGFKPHIAGDLDSRGLMVIGKGWS